jgi:hypothetical protein
MPKNDDSLRRDLDRIRFGMIVYAQVAVGLFVWLWYSIASREGGVQFTAFDAVLLLLALAALFRLLLAPSRLRFAKRVGALEQAVEELRGKVSREP